MQALGLIETRGLLAAIESADVMLKAADVSLLEKTYVGGGLVSIAVTGDVASVKAAVEAASAAVKHLDNTLLVSEHVIPRPHEDLENIIVSSTPPEPPKGGEEPPVSQEEPEFQGEIIDLVDSLASSAEIDEEEIAVEVDFETVGETAAIITEKISPSTEAEQSEIHKEDVDKQVLATGLEDTMECLNKSKVQKLRNLAREYKDFGIAGRLISKADKKLLLQEFRKYYEQS